MALDMQPGSLTRLSLDVPAASSLPASEPGSARSQRNKRLAHLLTGAAANGRANFGFSHEELDHNSECYYEGEFKIGLRYGKGTLISHGSKYVGQFEAEKYHGIGKREWIDGSRYEGEWAQGRKHGEGEYIDDRGQKYRGQWENGCKHGKGTQEYTNGDSYTGYWYKGLCSGMGTFSFADGSRYEGTWAIGRYDGLGVLYGADGSRERRCYSQGVLVSREVLEDGAPPPPEARRRDFMIRKVLSKELREEMLRPTILGMPGKSPYAIKKESDGWDLSAPPLRSKLLPAPHSSIDPLQISSARGPRPS